MISDKKYSEIGGDSVNSATVFFCFIVALSIYLSLNLNLRRNLFHAFLTDTSSTSRREFRASRRITTLSLPGTGC